MPEITMPMGRYLNERPTLKYFFFGGKGGVGKTVFAGAAAIGLARQGRRTLLVSTNPVHSLTGLFGRDMLGKDVAIEGVPNLSGPTRSTRGRASSAARWKSAKKSAGSSNSSTSRPRPTTSSNPPP